jgi:hypothetical protein
LDDGGDVDTQAVWADSTADHEIPDLYVQFVADNGVTYSSTPGTRLAIQTAHLAEAIQYRPRRQT